MNPKPLYAIDLTQNKKNEYADPTPFHSATLSPAMRARQAQASHDFSRRMWRSFSFLRLIAALICLSVGIMMLCSLLGNVIDALLSDTAQRLQGRVWGLLLVGVALLAAGLLLMRAHKKKIESLESDTNLNRAADQLEDVHQAIRAELGLPPFEEMTQIDLMPFCYRRVGDDIREVRPKAVYETIYAHLWREADHLYLTDQDAVMTIPLSAIESCTTLDDPIVISLWWKEEEPSEAPWAAIGITEDKEFHYHVPGYAEISIRADDGLYALRIPVYDLPAFQKLTGDFPTEA